jgi:hypothetical protein
LLNSGFVFVGVKVEDGLPSTFLVGLGVHIFKEVLCGLVFENWVRIRYQIFWKVLVSLISRSGLRFGAPFCKERQAHFNEYPTTGLRAILGFLIYDKSKLEDLLQSEEEYRKAMIAELKNPN